MNFTMKLEIEKRLIQHDVRHVERATEAAVKTGGEPILAPALSLTKQGSWRLERWRMLPVDGYS